MRLADVEQQIRTGDLFLFRGTGPLSRFIQFYRRSVFSHCGVAIWVRANGHSRLCIMEALWASGVRLYPMDVYLLQCARSGQTVDWYTVTDDAINREGVASYVLQRWADRYVSFAQMLLSFGWVTRTVRLLLGLPLTRELDPDRYFCSELCVAALRHAGYAPAPGEDVPAVDADPGTLALFPCLQRRGSLTT